MNCSACAKPNKSNLIIATKFWHVTVSSRQTYLGRSYVTLKRHCDSVSALTMEEWSEFIALTKKLESALKKAFKATTFNWTCLMNNAYLESPANPHVHWHFRPRYDHAVNFAGMTFDDLEFGYHYNNVEEKQKISPAVKKKIIDKIKQNLE